MILLDTDHLTVLKYFDSDRARRLSARLASAAATGEVIGTTVIGIEEQMRGWLAALAKERSPERWVGPYRELAGLFEFFQSFAVALWTSEAAKAYKQFAAIRIKANDRKAAAIAIAQNALLLTANRQDFERVPGLRFENWLDG